MKIGINLLLWTGNVTKEHLALVRQIAMWGFDLVEFPIFHYEAVVWKEFRTLLDELGIAATGCTIMSADLGQNLTSEHVEDREAGAEHLRRSLDVCAILKAKALVGPLHSPVGWFPTPRRGRTEDEWNRCVEGLQEAAEYANIVGVDMAIEPLNRFETHFVNTIGDALGLALAVNHRRVGVLGDTYHCHQEEEDAYRAFADCGKMLKSVHISESHRGVPGAGQVHWGKVFRALKEVGYDGPLVIESFSHTVPEIAKAASIWRKISPSQEAVAIEGLAFIKRMWREVESPITV